MLVHRKIRGKITTPAMAWGWMYTTLFIIILKIIVNIGNHNIDYIICLHLASRTLWKVTHPCTQFISPRYIPGTVLVSGDRHRYKWDIVPAFWGLVNLFCCTINSVCYVPVTSLSALHILTHLIIKTTIGNSYICTPNLQMRKLRHI